MKGLLTLIALSIILNFQSFGQPLNVAKLDSLFNSLASRDLAMGSLTISKNGIIQYQRAIGYSFIDKRIKVSANIYTKYRIGSVSKMFTAVLIFQLIDEGKISLDQKLNVYFPNLVNANKITISNLLNHRSGLHNYSDDDTNFSEWMDKPKTHEEMLKIISESKPDFEPNTKAEYCNTNYLLLSYIVEQVYNMSYKSVLKKKISSKIGLTNTYYGKQIGKKRNESSSYKYSDKTWIKQKETDMSIHSGAGSIVSTPTDLVKFMEALFSDELVSKPSLDIMKTMIDGYGMGIFPYDHNLKTGYGHNGRIEEFYSAVRYFPDDKLCIAYCTNGINYPRIDMLEGILKICFNEPFTIPFSRSIVLKSEDLDKYLGKYSTDTMPIVVTCLKDNNKLLLETGGTTLEVEPIGDDYFRHAESGSYFEFHPEKGELQIKETDNVYYLKREK